MLIKKLKQIRMIHLSKKVEQQHQHLENNLIPNLIIKIINKKYFKNNK